MGAVLTLNQPYGFSSVPKAWTLAQPAPGEHPSLEFQDGGQQKFVLSGNFLANANGQLSGTVDVVTLYSGGVKVFEIYGAENDVSMFLDPLLKGRFDTDLLPRLLSGNDYLYGSDGDDGLAGFGGNDTIYTGAGNDRIDAGAGDDVIASGPGNKTIDGGAGFDRVVESGALADFKIVRSGGSVTVTSLKDGSIDTLVNVERIMFGDKQVALDVAIDNHGGQAFRLYRAAFDRTPDEAGLRYWTMQLDKGMSENALANEFVKSAEFRTLYGEAPANRDLVVKFYQHILHREPDVGGLDFWTGLLDQHRMSQSEVLAAISESQENVAGTAPLIANGAVLDLPHIY